MATVLAAALAVLLVLPLGAGASTRLGPDLSAAPAGAIGGIESSSPSSYINVSSTNPGVVAASPIDGVVTKWAFRAGCCIPTQAVPLTLTLKTFRYLGTTAGGYLELEPVATGPSLVLPAGNALSADAPTELPAHLPIVAGQRVGIVADYPIMFSTYTSPNVVSTVLANGFKIGFAYTGSIAISAEVEADADGDGYGDETQDCQPGDPSQHEACKTVPPPAPFIPPPAVDPGLKCKSDCRYGKATVFSRPPETISTPRGDGGIVLPLSCPRNSTLNCTGILYMTLPGGNSPRISAAAPGALVKKSYSLKPGAKKSLRLLFPKPLMKFLSKKRTRKVIITVKPDGGAAMTRTQTLRFPKPL